MSFLVADIGGTKTVLALADCTGNQVHLSAECRYNSAEFATFDALLADYRAAHPSAICAAAFAVAGPVSNDQCETTNLPWRLCACELAAQFHLEKVRLLNDLEAVAWGIPALTPDQLLVLQTGNSHQRGNAVVVAAGTGLGQAGLFWDGQRHHPFATEGGHADFAAVDAQDVALLHYLTAQHGRVSWERVVSGMGIVNLYNYLAATNPQPAHPLLSKTQRDGGDLAATIAQLATTAACARCQLVMNWFAHLYGREAGNCALKHLAYGGVYLAGGIAAKNVALLQSGGFMNGFLHKGRMRELLATMPVTLVLDERVPLFGAARWLATI
ncbi:glucokinase [Thiospirillum jenense]|uniref:Glucokinase n=1 Tax=Thiospirillum jenense TaxID=1653858 RepID=A0A839HNT9_9GAMM|nr:glucokinase [Thiospirillum jenense]MBB1126982.1 glucokinase [Thiospirillum jenense]